MLLVPEEHHIRQRHERSALPSRRDIARPEVTHDPHAQPLR